MVDSGLGAKSAGNTLKTPNLGLRIGDTSRGAGDLRVHYWREKRQDITIFLVSRRFPKDYCCTSEYSS